MIVGAPALTKLRFAVIGSAAPQGSKTAGVNPDTGQVWMKESSAGVAPWRSAVGAAARTLWAPRKPIDEPVLVNIEFWVPRPGKATKVTQFNPNTPDLDKLVRSTWDGLTEEGHLLHDDARVVAGWYTKRAIAQRGDPTGAVIEVVLLGDLERAGYDIELTWRVVQRAERKTFQP